MGGSMTENEIIEALAYGGAYSLPYLIEIINPNYENLYFVNNTDDIIYDNKTYKAAAFKYTKPKTTGGVLKNGTLEISAIDNSIIDSVNLSDELLQVKAVGIITQSGDITPLKTFRHQYGTITTDEQLRVIITFTNDDRLEMNFPPYIMDAENNAGNV